MVDEDAYNPVLFLRADSILHARPEGGLPPRGDFCDRGGRVVFIRFQRQKTGDYQSMLPIQRRSSPKGIKEEKEPEINNEE